MNMKIISVNITEFGGLSDFHLEFADGLNIIEGRNESGKSTVLLFVMYMLFGIAKSSRKGTPGEFDKDRSISRRSNRAVGSMTVECDGVQYRIDRKNLKGGKNSTATVQDLATGEHVFAGREPGEALLGVSRETFESCLWCAQSRSFVISSEGVRDTLSNLSLTADESVNGDKVKKTIQDEKKRYKHERGNGGLLSDAIARVEAARARVWQIDEAMMRTEHLRDEAERLEGEKAAAEARRANADAALRARENLAIIDRFDSLARLRGELSQIEGQSEALDAAHSISSAKPSREMLYELRTLRNSLARRREELNAARAAAVVQSAVDMNAVELADKISASESEEGFIGRVKAALALAAYRKTCALAFLAAGAIALILAFITFFTGGIVFPILCAFAAVAFGVSAVMNYSTSQRKGAEVERELGELGMSRDGFEKTVRDAFAQRRIFLDEEMANQTARSRVQTAEQLVADAERECGEFFSRFGLEYSEDAADALAEQISDYLAAREHIDHKLSVKRELVGREAEALSKYDEAAIRAELPKEVRPVGDAQAEYDAANADYRRAEARLSDLRVRIATEGFDADARADAVAVLEAAKAERDKYKETFDVLTLAYDAVDRAYDNMRRNFAPKIREGAGEYLAKISGGRYASVMLSEDMEISVDDSGEAVPVGTMSTGTADAVYMALRMSLIGNIFEGAVPLFMDESLSSLDDTRAEGVLRMIEQFIGGGSQCLLFTCHSRERALCDKLNIEHNLITL